MEKDLKSIQSIFIKPHNENFIHYIINNNDEIHAMKLRDMFNFILQFTENRYSNTIHEYIYSFEYFIVYKNKEGIPIIEVLKPNQDTKYDYYLDKYIKKELDIKTIESSIQKENNLKSRESLWKKREITNKYYKK